MQALRWLDRMEFPFKGQSLARPVGTLPAGVHEFKATDTRILKNDDGSHLLVVLLKVSLHGGEKKESDRVVYDVITMNGPGSEFFDHFMASIGLGEEMGKRYVDRAEIIGRDGVLAHLPNGDVAGNLAYLTPALMVNAKKFFSDLKAHDHP